MTRKAAPDDRLARRLGLRGAPHGWIGLAVLILMISALICCHFRAAEPTRCQMPTRRGRERRHGSMRYYGYRIGDPASDSQPYL